MALLEVDQFFGERPAVHRYKLQKYEAQVAINTDLFLGAVNPLKGGTFLSKTAAVPPVSIYLNNGTWYEWANDVVDVVKSPIGDDAHDRVYFTGQGAPKFTTPTLATSGGKPYPADSLTLGIPAPTYTPAGTLGGTGSGTAETRFYLVTYVDSYGSEGPPSVPSNKITWQPGNTVSLTLPSAPTGDYSIAKVRIYRSATSGTTAIWQYVDEKAIGTASYTDSKAAEELGEEMPSATWYPPPTTMQGLVSFPGGFLAGFTGNELMFSEVALPHAWPTEYRLTVDYNIVALAVISGSLVVLTEGMPYIATGSSPGSMALSRIDIGQACVSKAGVVDFGNMVVYPSPDGLVGIQPNGQAALLTQLVYDRTQWQSFNPSTIKAYRWKTLYMAFTDNHEFLFNPSQPDAGIVELNGATPDCGFFDIMDNKLYLVFGDQLTEWGEGAVWPYTWKSRPFPLNNPTSMNVVQIFADSYPIEAVVYRDGTLQGKLSIANDDPHRIPNGERGREYEIEVNGTGGLYKIYLSTTMNELKGV